MTRMPPTIEEENHARRTRGAVRTQRPRGAEARARGGPSGATRAARMVGSLKDGDPAARTTRAREPGKTPGQARRRTAFCCAKVSGHDAHREGRPRVRRSRTRTRRAGCPKGSRNWPWGERDGGRAIEERCGRPSAGQSVACLARRLALSQVSRHLQRKRHAPSAGLGAKGRWGSWKEEAHLAVGSDVGCNDVELLLKAHLYPPSAPSQTQPAPHARTGKRDQGRD